MHVYSVLILSLLEDNVAPATNGKLTPRAKVISCKRALLLRGMISKYNDFMPLLGFEPEAYRPVKDFASCAHKADKI